MMADIGGTTTEEIIADLRVVAKADKLNEPDDVKSVLRGRLIQVLWWWWWWWWLPLNSVEQ